jgi:hypothetical protein
MKKITTMFLVSLLFVFTNPTKSQNVPTKYIKGWGTELNFNPFNGSLSLNNATGQIKVRRFLKNDLALRASVSIAYKNDNNSEKLVYGQQAYERSVKENSLLTTLNIGAEKHYNSGHRLSPYIGFELGLGLKTAKEEMGYNTFKRTIKGAWETTTPYYNGTYWEYLDSYTERGFMSGNITALTGFDFYMADNFFFGYELGFGVEYIKYSKIEITKDASYPSSGTIPDMENKSWRIGPRLENGIRIGYNF